MIHYHKCNLALHDDHELIRGGFAVKQVILCAGNSLLMR